jgi:SAM-dependent methyltransferase
MRLIQDIFLSYFEYLFKDTSYLVHSSPQWMIKPNPQAVLLDCGCGNGEYSLYLSKLLGTNQVIGIELNSILANQAHSIGVRTILADLNRSFPLPDNSIQVIITFNVLEHLVETETFIQEIFRVLVPKGYVIIDTPNLASWHNIIALVLGLQPFSGPNISSMTESDVRLVRRMHRRAHGLPEELEYIHTCEPERHRHLVVVAYRSIIKALKREGFTIDKAVGYGYYPLPPGLARLISRVDPWHSHHMVIKACKPLTVE